jgi:hypothetical protein
MVPALRRLIAGLGWQTIFLVLLDRQIRDCVKARSEKRPASGALRKSFVPAAFSV